MTEDELNTIDSIMNDYNVYYRSILENDHSLVSGLRIKSKDYKASLEHIQKHVETLNPCHYDYYCEREGGHIICEVKDKVEMLLSNIRRDEYLQRVKEEESKPKEIEKGFTVTEIHMPFQSHMKGEKIIFTKDIRSQKDER